MLKAVVYSSMLGLMFVCCSLGIAIPNHPLQISLSEIKLHIKQLDENAAPMPKALILDHKAPYPFILVQSELRPIGTSNVNTESSASTLPQAPNDHRWRNIAEEGLAFKLSIAVILLLIFKKWKTNRNKRNFTLNELAEK